MRSVRFEGLEYYSRSELAGLNELGSGRGRKLGRGAVFGSSEAELLDLREIETILRTEFFGSRRTVAGFEIVLSAPKSVSVLWALTEDKWASAIHSAHVAAVDATHRYIEETESAVTTGPRWRRSSGLSSVSFDHALSRSHDPHLHSHLLIINSIRPDLAEDASQSRAVDSGRLYRAESMFRNVYRHELWLQLNRVTGMMSSGDVGSKAVEFERILKLEEEFSSRRATVLSSAKRYGGSPRARQIAALTDRPSKIVSNLPDLRRSWLDRSNGISPDPAVVLERLFLNRLEGVARGPLHAEVRKALKSAGVGETDDALAAAVELLGIKSCFDVGSSSYGGVLGRLADDLGTLELAKRIIARRGGDPESVREVLRAKGSGLANYRLASEVRRMPDEGLVELHPSPHRSSSLWSSYLSATLSDGSTSAGGTLVVVHPGTVAPSEIVDRVMVDGKDSVILLRSASDDIQHRLDLRPEAQGHFRFAVSEDLGLTIWPTNSQAVGRVQQRLDEFSEACSRAVVVANAQEARDISEWHLGEMKIQIERAGPDGVRVIVPPSFRPEGLEVCTGTLFGDRGEYRLECGEGSRVLNERQLKYFRNSSVRTIDEIGFENRPTGLTVLQTRPDQPTLKGDVPAAGEVVVSVSALVLDLPARTMLRSLGTLDKDCDAAALQADFIQMLMRAVPGDRDIRRGYDELVMHDRPAVDSEMDGIGARKKFDLSRVAIISSLRVSGLASSHFEGNQLVTAALWSLPKGQSLTLERRGEVCLERSRTIELSKQITSGRTGRMMEMSTL